MRAALEAVAEFLTKCGALDESKELVSILSNMGHTVPDTSPLHWRMLIAGMKEELRDRSAAVNYVFLYERLVQLYCTVPTELYKELFSSPLIFHILVERFASAFQGLDAKLFKLESDVLCKTEGVYDMCQGIQSKLFAGETSEEPSRLSAFLESFSNIFLEDEPLEAWEAFHEQHCINEASFRRDMKRALCAIEDAALGPTQIELKFPDPESSDLSNKAISRELIESRFSGDPNVWSDLSVVNTIAIAKPSSADEGGRAEDIIEAIDCDEAEDRVWSSRLPITVDGADSDSSPSDAIATSSAPRAAESVASPSPRDSPAVTNAVTVSDSGGRASPRPQTQQQRSEPTDAEARAVDPTVVLRHRGKRKRWSNEEVDALLKGHREFEAHPNIWVMIQNKYNPILRDRTNVDLKDKYRNLLKYNKIPRSNA